MKFSDGTLSLLKNFTNINESILFRPGNTIATITERSNVYATAIVPETFERECAIYQLSKFLGVISLFDEPDVDFAERQALIKNGKQSVRYTYADPRMIKAPPVQGIKAPNWDVSFELSAGVLQSFLKGLHVMQLPEMAIIGDGETITIEAINASNATNDTYKHEVGETDQVFKTILEQQWLVMLPKDYTVGISRKGLVSFSRPDLTYFIAASDKSKFS